jgi:RES domain-containing protein
VSEPVTAWRLVRPAHAAPDDAFSGEGARLYGGRWNSAGVRMVYLSSTLSLAALETLAHAEPRALAHDWVTYAVEIPEDLALELRIEDLPADWRDMPTSTGTRRSGDAWAAANASVALSVPSAIVPVERNWLLNPAHPEFGRLAIPEPQTFRFDARVAGDRTR